MLFNMNNICLGCMKAEYRPDGTCPECGCRKGFANQDHQLFPSSSLNGRYLVGRAIGQGGFGITYVGYDMQKNEKVAIKEFYPNGCVTRRRDGYTVKPYTGAESEAQFETERDKFLREAEQLAAMEAIPNIVNVRGCFLENETAYIVMDFIEGPTLKSHLVETGVLTMYNAVNILTPIAAALSKIHSLGFMHRDVSPDNIILSPDGAVLLDFGSARPITVGSDVTKTINIKSGYAPQEQYFKHSEQGAWTDVYALAATVYRAVTGQVPVSAFERTEMNDPLIPPRKLNTEILEDEEKVLLKGLARLPKDRYQSVSKFFDALRAAGGVTMPILNAGTETAPAAPAKKPVGWIVSTVICALAAVGLGITAGVMAGDREYYEDRYVTVNNMLEQADGKIESVEAELSDVKKTLEWTELKWESAKDDLSNARRTLEEKEGELENAYAELDAKNDELSDARAELKKAEGNLVAAEGEVTSAQLEQKKAEDELKTAQGRLDKIASFTNYNFIFVSNDIFNYDNGVHKPLKASEMKTLMVEYEYIFLNDSVSINGEDLHFNIYAPDGTLLYYPIAGNFTDSGDADQNQEGRKYYLAWGNTNYQWEAGMYWYVFLYKNEVLTEGYIEIQ